MSAGELKLYIVNDLALCYSVFRSVIGGLVNVKESKFPQRL